jgi:carbamate kinase
MGLGKLSLEKALQYLKNNQFPAGSMGPKVEACIRFIKYGGERSIITSLDQAVDALDGRAGTHILPEKKG